MKVTPPIKLSDLGLTEQQIEEFVKGARIAYGQVKPAKVPEHTLESDLFTTPIPRK